MWYVVFDVNSGVTSVNAVGTGFVIMPIIWNGDVTIMTVGFLEKNYINLRVI